MRATPGEVGCESFGKCPGINRGAERQSRCEDAHENRWLREALDEGRHAGRDASRQVSIPKSWEHVLLEDG